MALPSQTNFRHCSETKYSPACSAMHARRMNNATPVLWVPECIYRCRSWQLAMPPHVRHIAVTTGMSCTGMSCTCSAFGVVVATHSADTLSAAAHCKAIRRRCCCISSSCRHSHPAHFSTQSLESAGVDTKTGPRQTFEDHRGCQGTARYITDIYGVIYAPSTKSRELREFRCCVSGPRQEWVVFRTAGGS